MHSRLPGFLRRVKELGLLAGLETNGTNPDMIRRLLAGKLVDFVAMDIKSPLERAKYGKASGALDGPLFENVLKSVRLIMRHAPDYEFRTTVVPGLHEEKDILRIAERLKGAKMYVLQQFMPKNTVGENMRDLSPFPAERLFEIRRKIKKHFADCEVRNV